MYINSLIPDKVLEQPNAQAFLNVIELLQEYKQENISTSSRVNNAVLNMDRKWLLKKLSDYGVTDIPYGYPIVILQQYLLNIDRVLRLRGSKLGISLYCSVLSLGEVTIDDSSFVSIPSALFLDDPNSGKLTDDSLGSDYFLVQSTTDFNKAVTLGVTINSKYFASPSSSSSLMIREYLESSLPKFIGFSPNRTINFTYNTRSDYYFHSLLNPYFI